LVLQQAPIGDLAALAELDAIDEAIRAFALERDQERIKDGLTRYRLRFGAKQAPPGWDTLISAMTLAHNARNGSRLFQCCLVLVNLGDPLLDERLSFRTAGLLSQQLSEAERRQLYLEAADQGNPMWMEAARESKFECTDEFRAIVSKRFDAAIAAGSGEVILALVRDKMVDDIAAGRAAAVAAMNGDCDLLDELLKLGVDKNVAGHGGKPLLTLAAERERYATVEMLLSRSVDVNATDEMGRTALHYVMRDKHDVLAAILVRAGGDDQLKDKYGDRPVDLKRGSN
jgi:ankyrin repeat protein